MLFTQFVYMCTYINSDDYFNSLYFFFFRGVKSQELDTPAIEKRFAYTFLQQLITYVDQAQQHMMEFGEMSSREKWT